MKLEVLSEKGVLVSKEVSSVILPGLEGSFGVLPDHTPFLSILTKGHLTFFAPDETSMDIEGGFVEVRNDRVCVCLTV
jgi:F-type H+-transporting ATPase subunit epsilon